MLCRRRQQGRPGGGRPATTALAGGGGAGRCRSERVLKMQQGRVTVEDRRGARTVKVDSIGMEDAVRSIHLLGMVVFIPALCEEEATDPQRRNSSLHQIPPKKTVPGYIQRQRNQRHIRYFSAISSLFRRTLQFVCKCRNFFGTFGWNDGTHFSINRIGQFLPRLFM